MSHPPAVRPRDDVEPAPTRGHKKKARTRRLLLDAALEALAEEGEGFTIADITDRAGVANGTFYNYFADRDALIVALVTDIVEVFTAGAEAVIDDADPAARFAHITARAMQQADGSRATIRAALRLQAAQQALLPGEPFTHLRQDLADGYAAGRFAQPPDDATLDVVVGALLQAARRIVDGRADADYRRTVIRRLLQALGIDPAEAATLADRAVDATT